MIDKRVGMMVGDVTNPLTVLLMRLASKAGVVVQWGLVTVSGVALGWLWPVNIFTVIILLPIWIAWLFYVWKFQMHRPNKEENLGNYIDVANLYLHMPKDKRKQFKGVMSNVWKEAKHSGYHKFPDEKEVFAYYAVDIPEHPEKADSFKEELAKIRLEKKIMEELPKGVNNAGPGKP